VPEPIGGAHRDPDAMATTLKNSLRATIGALSATPLERLLEERKQRLMQIGEFDEH
jgi:acetyl-CoA carboxylase carboxyl transferase subunit alpha